MNFTFTLESESKIQDKQKFTKIFSWKKLISSGATRPLPNCPSPPLSSSWPLHAEIFLPLCRLFTPSDSQGRAGSTHVGAPGSTPGVEDGDGWQRNKDPPRCRCSLRCSLHVCLRDVKNNLFFLQTLLFTAFLVTVLKILTYALVST